MGVSRYLREFIGWWLWETPKRLFKVGHRYLILINNQLSFTLNIRLLFTPLFGDYSFIGRFIGFSVRIFEIIFGLIFVGILTIVFFAVPLIWWLAPVVLFPWLNVIPFIAIAVLYLLHIALNKDTPEKKVSDVSLSDVKKSFRPATKYYLALLRRSFHDGVLALFENPQVKFLLKKTELELPDFIKKISEARDINLADIETKTFEMAKKQQSRYVELEQLFLTVIENMPKCDLLLGNFGTKLSILQKATQGIVSDRERLSRLYLWQDDYKMLFTGGIGKGMTGHVTPRLDAMSEDFTKQAKKGGYERFTVRENSIKKIGEMLSGSNENILVIGDPGSGKTSLVKGIAYKIIEGTEYKSLKNKRIVSIELSGMIGGTASSGQLAQKINDAIKEAQSSRDIILFVDEIHTLVSGGEGSLIYSILEPILSSGTIQFLAATTKQNYRKYIEPNGAFSRLFNLLELEPATKEETLSILKFDVEEIETKRGLFVTYPALEKIVDLSEKLIHERVLPDKAVQILDRVASAAAHGTKIVNTDAVEKEIAEMTHIPMEAVTQEEATKLLNIEELLKQMVIGQDFAIKQISSALKRARAGMRDEKKPIASFLFVGTTGVGKTQTAKALAKNYCGDAKNMIRLDMSEYQQLDSINRLLGTPDGSTKGILTEKVRTQPFALLLLDEIEKAHPNILLTFLQVLDDGRLTDSSGLTVDFTNTIIIATSNAGTKVIQEAFTAGKNPDEMKETAMMQVREKFAPEFLNRFNGIIVFNPLTKDNAKNIAKLLFKEVAIAAEHKGIKLSFTDDLISKVVEKGYSPEWGARPMSRVIEDTVESYLAEKILSQQIKQGDEIELGSEILVSIT